MTEGSVLMQRIGLRLPIIQAPMAGVATPELAAAVTETGGLGSLGIGASDIDSARSMIEMAQSLTDGPINVNVFCHAPTKRNLAIEAAWLDRLAPEFRRFGVDAPTQLHEIYGSFLDHSRILSLLLELRPAVVSFHFGLPSHEAIAALQSAGCVLLASATSLEEGRQVKAAGLDAVVAQGFEAGGHRGIFDPDGPDERLSTLELTRQIAKGLDLPVVSAGGIMDGSGIAAALAAGAFAVQMGTAFIGCRESAADDAYRAALAGDAAHHTMMTRAISGRPARVMVNRLARLVGDADAADVPAYPCTYDASKALNSAARAAGDTGYGATWAGQCADLARVGLSARELVETLGKELALAQS